MLLRPLLFAATLIVVAVLAFVVHALTHHVRGHTSPTRRAAKRWYVHAAIGAVAAPWLLAPVLVLVLGLTAVRYAGGVRASAADVRAHLLHLPAVQTGGARGGASTPFIDAGVEDYAPPTRDQGSLEACAGFASTTALMIELKEEGVSYPYANFSGAYPWGYAVNGQNVGTTLDAIALAGAYHGYVQEARYGNIVGIPPATLSYYALMPGVSYRYLDGSEAQADSALLEGYAPLLNIPLHGDFYNDFGVEWGDLYGAGYYGNHWITLEHIYADGSFLIQNSWNGNFGQGGFLKLPRSSWSQIQQVGLIAPGAHTAWPNLQRIVPIVAPTAAARPTSTSRPTPTRTPRPTATPAPVRYRVTTAMALRSGPRLDAGRYATVRPGWIVVGTGQTTPHWAAVDLPGTRAKGWILKVDLTRL